MVGARAQQAWVAGAHREVAADGWSRQVASGGQQGADGQGMARIKEGAHRGNGMGGNEGTDERQGRHERSLQGCEAEGGGAAAAHGCRRGRGAARSWLPGACWRWQRRRSCTARGGSEAAPCPTTGAGAAAVAAAPQHAGDHSLSPASSSWCSRLVSGTARREWCRGVTSAGSRQMCSTEGSAQ